METRKRTLIRTIIWRICAYTGTSVSIFILTRDLASSFSVGLIDHSIKFIFQFGYERVWNRIQWGREEEPPLNLSTKCNVDSF